MKTNKKTQTNFNKNLYIVATPIGNLNDISRRAASVLEEADCIICENPNHSIKLLNKLGIKKKLLSLHDYNEENVINQITKYKNNTNIALVSDAGSPLISDPGYRLMQHCIDQNYYITSIPGPSALICALQLSGLPIDNFAYFGFVPKQKTKIIAFFNEINNINLTSVFFVSAKNLVKVIETINEILGNRKISICKEITKYNETVYRGSIKSIRQKIKKKAVNLKGEFTIVLSRLDKKHRKNIDEGILQQLIKLQKKYSLTETVKIVHNLTNISKKDIYQTAIKLKHD